MIHPSMVNPPEGITVSDLPAILLTWQFINHIYGSIQISTSNINESNIFEKSNLFFPATWGQ